MIPGKCVSSRELSRSFEEQVTTYDARVKQIKYHRSELEQQLNAFEVSNAIVTLDN